jgi:hypothetical protein
MSVLRNIKRLQFIDLLVRKKSTGSLETFSKKNGLSKRGLVNIIQDMKELGFPIKYSRKFNSYYYYEDGEMVKRLFVKTNIDPASNENMQERDYAELCFSPTKIYERCRNPDM